MKQILLICLLIISVQACTDTNSDYKAERQKVLDAHDKVMADAELAVRNKIKLDTILLRLDSFQRAKVITDSIAERKLINGLIGQLNKADNDMNDWMHHFEADVNGKSKEEASAYFRSEMHKINSLDSLYQFALKESDTYLNKFKK